MSSLGNQWRMIRHYLSSSNLHGEVEKLIQKIKPATPKQWDDLIKRFEKMVSVQMSSTKEITVDKLQDASGAVLKPTKVEESDTNTQVANSELKEVKQKDVGSDIKESMTVESLWQGLKLKKDTHLGKISEPTWKSNKQIMTKTSIHSRTAYVVSAIESAASPESVLRRTERLIDHLHEYPEARDYAIKEGAVRALLRVQHGAQHGAAADVLGAANEALALVGYAAPPRWAGANVLSLDGGGIRGIIAIEILRHLERLTGRKVHELFDYIIGVSTGAIIAAVVGGGVGSLAEARRMYMTLSRDMFGNTSRLGGASRLVWTHSYYDTQAWEKMLQDNLKDSTLAHCNRNNMPKLAIVSCVVNAGSRLSPYLFRSYSVGYRVRSAFPGTSRAKLWHAVRASAAAPTYFDEFRLHGLLHQDGGIMVNNPAGVGLHEARLLFGADAVARGALVSVGTGRALAPHQDYGRLARDASHAPGTSWRDKFNKILDSATDTEGVHLVLNDLIPAGNYYRFNPPLMQECAMDEIDEHKLENLLVDTAEYIRRNQHKFARAAEQLTRRRSVAQRCADALRERAVRAGL
ncbi:unnamed protein product [Arctia plantaginis]|uniref:PNPLA domain-containing protein n=1 Tax=Arctia plantaginis TaxID=874455 RepID=A0A8S0Z7F3_ARCPL|nr:unnamed protein product [Arctia plantaginis]